MAVLVASGSGPGLVTAVSRRVLHSTQTNPSGLSCHVQPRRPDLLGPLPDHTPTPQRAPREKPGLLERARGGGDPACASSALLARAAVLAVGGQTPAGDGVPVPEPGLRQRRPEQAPPRPPPSQVASGPSKGFARRAQSVPRHLLRHPRGSSELLPLLQGGHCFRHGERDEKVPLRGSEPAPRKHPAPAPPASPPPVCAGRPGAARPAPRAGPGGG